MSEMEIAAYEGRGLVILIGEDEVLVMGFVDEELTQEPDSTWIIPLDSDDLSDDEIKKITQAVKRHLLSYFSDVSSFEVVI